MACPRPGPFIKYVFVLLVAAFLLASCDAGPSPAGTRTAAPGNSTGMIAAPATGMSVQVTASGSYTISARIPAWSFGGTLGQQVHGLVAQNGSDAIGDYTELTFQYHTTTARGAAIRLYDNKPIVLFTDTYVEMSDNTSPFPRLTTFPNHLFHLSYKGAFAHYSFNAFSEESPWLFFDSSHNAFLLSPASNFMIASTRMAADGSIASGINATIPTLPRGFTHKTFLVIQPGINAIYDTWGHAMTDLQGKTRPANDANIFLNTLGYWTDNGGTYYYNYNPSLGYEGTLLAVRNSFLSRGIPLGYMQLDSWWYTKGSAGTWQGDKGNDRGGISTYTTDPAIFPDGLQGFQQQLGLPLITHARWIDPGSPYRKTYSMSNNVSTDPRYWNAIATYLKRGGVITYEQDWLDQRAVPAMNLTDPDAFMNNMASAMANQGITMQYCLALPRFYLQSSKYSNLTTLRVSNDHFQRSRWDPFLYTSRLAGALGAWPWSDVFMSTEINNLLLSTLSAGVVGVGDPIGAESKDNLFQTIRADGVLVKPDVPLAPLDEMYVNDAQGIDTPMIASTYTDHEGMRASYVFAYKRGNVSTVTFQPSQPGMPGKVYVYNYFSRMGRVVDARTSYSDTVADASYYIVAPIGPSGIAFLGDAGKFVALGQKRISALSDNGTVQATIAFAKGETAVTLHGYAPSAPKITAAKGTLSAINYDSTTHLFTFVIAPGGDGSAVVSLNP